MHKFTLSLSSFLVCCRHQRAKPVIIDPGLYSLKKSDVFWVSQKRSVPTAYKLFTGNFLHILLMWKIPWIWLHMLIFVVVPTSNIILDCHNFSSIWPNRSGNYDPFTSEWLDLGCVLFQAGQTGQRGWSVEQFESRPKSTFDLYNHLKSFLFENIDCYCNNICNHN